MKRYNYILFCVFLLNGVDSFCNDVANYVFLNDGTPSEAIRKLLDITKVECKRSAQEIITATQAQWLRNINQERWNISDQELSCHEELQKWLKENGFIDAIQPKSNKYTYFIILGGLAERVKSRLLLARDLLTSGKAECEKMIMLCGERPLDTQQESFESFAYGDENKNKIDENIKTEADMMHYMVNAYSLASDSTEWYSVPMIETEDNKQRRPTTDDTIIAWKKSQPKPGSCLVFSTQPYGLTQRAALAKYMSKEFTFDLATTACSTDVNDRTHLDNLARWMYQEWQLAQNK